MKSCCRGRGTFHNRAMRRRLAEAAKAAACSTKPVSPDVNTSKISSSSRGARKRTPNCSRQFTPLVVQLYRFYVVCVRPSTCPLFQPHLRSERACWWYFCNAQFNGYEFSLQLGRPLAVVQFERTKRSSRRAGKMSWAIPPPLFRIVFSVSRCNCVEPLVAVVREKKASSSGTRVS